MSDISKRVANLTPEQRALLEERLLVRRTASTATESLKRRTPEGPCPLSYAQQWLWLLAQLLPESIFCNEPTALRIRGDLDTGALERSLSEILRRQEALRTSFTMVDGQPVQTVAAAAPFSLPTVDLSGIEDSEREDEARRLAAEERARVFDLSRGPMIRGRLIRLNDRDHVLVLVTHHIATDGWSAGVLLKELSILYEAFSAGKPSPLAELPIQYSDFTRWQLEQLGGGVLESQLPYWKEKLSGAPVLELPTDRPRPQHRTFRGGRHDFTIAPDLAAALDVLSRGESATLFMTLLAAYHTLLYRYTRQEDIVVGSPIAYRNRVELEGLVGLVANMLALRMDLSGDPTFRELVGRAREVALGAFAHQDLPFEKLVGELLPNPDLSRPPLAQVAFVFLDSPYSNLSMGGLECAPFEIDRGTAKFELAFFAGRDAKGLTCTFEYNGDLFDSATVERMERHFVKLLESATANPDERISRLRIMSEAELHKIVVEWNDTGRPYPRDKCVHGVFQERASKAPDSIAAVFGSDKITYGELDERANRLANYLAKLGVGAGAAVAVMLEQSVEFVVAVLGILKAGAAYAPIEPGFPKERMEFMLRDTGARAVLTQEHLADRLPVSGAKKVCLDSDWPIIKQESAAAPRNAARPDGAACLMYTSGSTGEPKGAIVTHRGMNRLALNTNYIEIEPGDRIAQASIISFDAAMFEIWGALLNGATLVGVPKPVLLSADGMREFLREQGITVMFLTTSIFSHFARTAPEIFKPLRWLSFGGEAGDANAARMVLRSGFAGALVNAYGPTETTTFATWYTVREVPEGAVGVPIGRPIANTTVYILDAALQPVPVGVPGEILIGGDGVALGYLNRPELTAEKFVPDPFGGVAGARLYRTGDLGRFLADGNIEFLGRTDDQIKIRGFRIEPGEIEAAITRNPAIREAAVVCRTDGSGDKRLVAYVVARGTERPAARDLRAFLGDKLPEFMLPAAFVFLDRMPTTASGKTNRKGLPEANAAAAVLEKDFVAPRTPVEGALAKIWADALHVEKVGVRDSFFELGGHSLLAVRVFTQIEKVFGKRLPLTALFTAPTIEKLAEAVGDKGRRDLFPPIVAIEKGGGGGPIFGIATADAFIYARLSEHLGASQPFYGLHPQGIIPVENPVIDMRALAARYADEIRAVRPHGPYRLLGMCAGGIVAYEVAQNLAAGGETVDFVGMIDTAGPFGSWTSALLRMREVNRVLDHAYHHVMTLWTLPPGKRLSYLTANAARIKRKILGQPLPSTGASKEAPVERAYWMVYNGAYLSALARYKPKPYPGRVALFIASRAESERFSRSRLKWRKFAQGGADIYEVPGIHSEMLADEQARIIAGYLEEHFAKMERGSGDVRQAR